jgi:hypothetical protein
MPDKPLTVADSCRIFAADCMKLAGLWCWLGSRSFVAYRSTQDLPATDLNLAMGAAVIDAARPAVTALIEQLEKLQHAEGARP